RRGDDRRHLASLRPRRIGIDLENRSNVVSAQARIVGLHPAEVPELAADLVEAVWRRRLRDQMDRAGIARDAQFVFLDADVADEHDGAAGVVGRVREQRRDVRRAPRRRLRANRHGRRDNDERPPTNPESQIPNPDHMTFFCAARYRMVPSATKSSAPLMYPLTPSCRNGSTVPTDCGPAMCPVPT